MGYEYLVNGDIGFKIVDNKNNADIDERLVRQPYIFLRSEIKREIRISPPQTLYLSQIKGYVDYEIKFRSPANLDTFLEFFPEKIFDDEKTESYYFIPSTMPQDMPQPQDPLESNEMSESHDTSDWFKLMLSSKTAVPFHSLTTFQEEFCGILPTAHDIHSADVVLATKRERLINL